MTTPEALKIADTLSRDEVADLICDYFNGLQILREKGYAMERMPLVYTAQQVPADSSNDLY